MRLKHYLTEKLNWNYKLDSVNKSSTYFSTEWKISDEEYEFSGMFRDPEMLQGSTWSTLPEKIKTSGESWEIAFGSNDWSGSPFGITGKMGTKSPEVFSGVAASLKKFITSVKPNVFYFSAKEPSRIRLNDRLAKIITKKWPAYKLTTDKTDQKYYIFER